MKLYVDDMRPFPENGFICCRDYNEAIFLLSRSDFEYISLDYHLGEEKETGLDILIWMKNNGKHVPHINIHSSHPIGSARMFYFCKENFISSVVTRNYPY